MKLSKKLTMLVAAFMTTRNTSRTFKDPSEDASESGVGRPDAGAGTGSNDEIGQLACGPPAVCGAMVGVVSAAAESTLDFEQSCVFRQAKHLSEELARTNAGADKTRREITAYLRI